MNAVSKIALAALVAVALAPLAAHAEKVNLSYLTHWSPESVAMLEKAATAYGKDHPDVSVSVRAVSLLHGGLEWRVGALRRYPSCDADEFGLPELAHSVERFDRDGNLGRASGVVA